MMSNPLLRRQAVPLAILLLLIAAGVVTAVLQRRVNEEHRAFSIDYYERLMHRIDVAIASISETMIREGMTVDLDELLERAAQPPPSEEALSSPEPEATRQALVLNGIAWNPKLPLAFINGKTVEQGDQIGDAEIADITETQVVVRYRDGNEDVLSLVESDEE